MEAWRWREGLLLATAFVFSVGWAGASILILFIVAMGELIAGEPLWRSTSIDRSLAVLIAIAFLSALWSDSRQGTLVTAGLFAVPALVVIRAVVLSALRDPRFTPRFLVAWAIGGVAASLYGMARMGHAVDARAETPSLGYNGLGTTLAVAVVLLLSLSLDGPRRRRLLYVTASAIVAVGLVLTWSRGAWLGAILGLGTLLGATSSRRLWVGVLVAAAVLTAATPVLAPRWQWQSSRLRNVAVTEGPFSRIAVWKVARRIIADHPVLGTGLGTFASVYGRYAGESPSEAPPTAHNIFLNFAVETGLLGLAALLSFLGTGIWAMVRWNRRSAPGSSQRAMSAAVLAAFAALMGHQLVDGTVMGVHIAVGLYALLALGAAADRQLRDTA